MILKIFSFPKGLPTSVALSVRAVTTNLYVKSSNPTGAFMIFRQNQIFGAVTRNL